ncbi:MAG: conjugal transfer protein TraX [Oscillospiraceae bacterium]|nr:conjugal transfer protein TraX [Oscillospiraceae bacterium]
MTVDHFGIVLNMLYRYKIAGVEFDHYMTDAFWQMRVIGRMAFPIFCFLVAEGCTHTRDIKKYIGRLAVFAIISQIPHRMFQIAKPGFHIAAGDLFKYTSGNVLITLMFGAIAAFFYAKLFETGKNIFLCKVLPIVGIAVSFIAVELLRGEYGLYGVVTILLVYALRSKDDSDRDVKIWGSKYAQILFCGITSVIYYLFYQRISLYAIGAILSVLPLLLYNQKPGHRRYRKWMFYIYYPAHMVILSVLIYFIVFLVKA